MSSTVELSARRGFGGGKAWIARIEGTDEKFGLAREFVCVRTDQSKSGKTATVSARVGEGLYECCSTNQQGKDSVFVVVTMDDGDAATARNYLSEQLLRITLLCTMCAVRNSSAALTS